MLWSPRSSPHAIRIAVSISILTNANIIIIAIASIRPQASLLSHSHCCLIFFLIILSFSFKEMKKSRHYHVSRITDASFVVGNLTPAILHPILYFIRKEKKTSTATFPYL